MNYKDKIEKILRPAFKDKIEEILRPAFKEGGEVPLIYTFKMVKLIEQAQRDAIEEFAKWYDQDIFPEKGYAEQMVGKYLNQTKEDVKEKQ